VFLEERKHRRNDSAIAIYLFLDGQEIPQKAFVLNFAPDGFLIKTFEGLALQVTVSFRAVAPAGRHQAAERTLPPFKGEVIWCHHLFAPQEDYFLCGVRCLDSLGMNLSEQVKNERISRSA